MRRKQTQFGSKTVTKSQQKFMHALYGSLPRPDRDKPPAEIKAGEPAGFFDLDEEA